MFLSAEMTTLTKRFRVILLCAAAFLVSAPVFSGDWVLAAQAFSVAHRQQAPESVVKASEVLPQLMLEQVSSNKTRVLPPGETLDRNLDSLLTERLSLFLQLSKAVKERDSLVVSKKSPRELEKALVSADDAVREIQEKIEENLRKADEASGGKVADEEGRDGDGPGFFKKLSDGIGQRLPFPFPFFRRDEGGEIVAEPVRLYKDDPGTLFAPSETAASSGVGSYDFSREVVAAKINGLVTGTISVYGEYVGVTAEVFVYPGAKSVGSVSDVGALGDLVPLAKRLVQKILPKVANSFPVVVDFHIEPENARPSAVVTIDGVVHSDIGSAVILDAGIHTVCVEAKGFEPAVLTYPFKDDGRFVVRAELVPEFNGGMDIRLGHFRDGFFLTGAIESSHFGYSDDRARISVNGKNVLSVFEDSSTGERAFVRISEKIASDGASLVVNAEPYDRAENIDRRRRGMYLAYSALICSLPATFYCMGEFESANNSYYLGRGTYDDALAWQMRSNVTKGISAALGVWFIVEMVRYLWSANGVLPAEARIDRKPERRIVSTLADTVPVRMNVADEQVCGVIAPPEKEETEGGKEAGGQAPRQ